MLLRQRAIQRLLHVSSPPPIIRLRPAVLRTCAIVRTYHHASIATRLAADFPVSRPTSRHGFEIAIVCALPLEADAVDAAFDVRWDDDGPPFDKAPGDPNAYTTGAIGRHNVVLAHMPGMGKASAASVAAHCRASFPNLKLALVVGVCGVVPFGPTGEEIMLGDVIISDGVVQYDFGRRLADRFVRKDTLADSLGRPNAEIRGVLAKLRGLRGRKQLGGKLAHHLDSLELEPFLEVAAPSHGGKHVSKKKGTSGNLASKRTNNLVQPQRNPKVHFGLIASGDSVIKSGRERDALATAEGVIAFEMEGAGVWENLPCIVIKGACDYADSYKNKVWQPYAAATAAACTKAFLSYWVPSFTSGSLLGEFNKTRSHGVYSIPYSKNPDFVGRTNIANSVKDVLFTDNETENNQLSLVGLGGIGKTQLALHLAHWLKENNPEYSVLWIPAFSMASFEEACMNILIAFDKPCGEKDDAKVLMREHLSSEKSGNWFLIVDNADDISVLEEIIDFLPTSNSGRTLFTTRSQEVAVTATGSSVIRLPEMSQNEAVAFLERSLIDKSQMQDENIVTELLAELTNLPLAIAQVAAYVNMNQVSIKEYLRIFQNTDQDMIELLSSGFRNSMHYFNTQGAIATTWAISFTQIRDKSAMATSLLSYLSCIEPKGIPRSLLPTLETEQQMTRTIGILCGYGFMSKRGDEETFDMHSLVHLATRIWTENEGDSDEARRDVLRHIAGVLPSDDWENRELWRQYLPHVLKLLRSRRECGVDYFQLGYWASRCLTKDSRYEEAIEIVQLMMEILKSQGGSIEENDPMWLEWQRRLAVAYNGTSRFREAVEIMEHVLGLWTVTVDENDSSRLTAEHTLAVAYQGTGNISEAIKLLEGVVQGDKKLFPEDTPRRLVSQTSLAFAYESDGQLDRSIQILEHVLGMQTATVSIHNPDRYLTQHQLTRTYYKSGMIKEAVQVMKLTAEHFFDNMDSREAFFMEEVAAGEADMDNTYTKIDAAISLFRALKVYPNVPSLIDVYDKTCPKDVLDILAEMIARDPSLDILASVPSPDNELENSSNESAGQESPVEDAGKDDKILEEDVLTEKTQ